MGKLLPFVREFRPDAKSYNALAQKVAAEYLTSLSVYGINAQIKLRYRFAIHDSAGKLVTLTIYFNLEGTILSTELNPQYENGVLSRGAAELILNSINMPKVDSIGEAIVNWQLALHELFHSYIEWELWEFFLDNEENRGWIHASR